MIPFLLLYESSTEGDGTIPTEEDILNSIDIPDCYRFESLTCMASEGEIVQWVERWAKGEAS